MNSNVNIPIAFWDKLLCAVFGKIDSPRLNIVDLPQQVQNLLSERINDTLKTLTSREETVIRMYFGVDDGKRHTLEEVGQYFNLTRERIRQIKAKALRKLRHPVRSNRFRDFLNEDSENIAFCTELFKQNNNCRKERFNKGLVGKKRRNR